MAATPPLIALKNARLAFGATTLFSGLDLALANGERACLVGRNGTGKSSLLKIIAGLQDLDGGERFVQPGTKVAYLPQDPQFDSDETIAAYVTRDPAGGPDAPRHAVDAVLLRLELDGTRKLGGLSGGEGRRVALARCLVSDPEVLLLDEPTNHLDLPTIDWLEGELKRFRGALLVISHDRTFLSQLTNTTLWLDRGRLQRLDKSFAYFEDWAEELRQQEAEQQHKLERQIVREERWLQRGVTARRKRNQGRLARLQGLRRERAEWLNQIGTAKLETASSGRSGDMVVEAETLSKSFSGAEGEVVILKDFSTRIRRGDRLGIIGPNGAGKSTLVKILIGSLAPDSGKLKIGANVEPLYFDQRRESLDPEATLWQVLAPDGGDTIIARGRQRHVVSYLKDFLFDESQARQPVKALSGGEKARLLLARLFARPSNLLVLDEPTNDLDMETLDLLEEVLSDYEGTLILVSHDRDFLDRLVSSVIAMEGGGRTVEVAGGYSDYLHYKKQRGETARSEAKARAKAAAPRPEAARPKKAAKLSYKDQRELDQLPGRIDKLTAEVTALEEKLADPQLYAKDPGAFAETTKTLTARRAELAAAEERWLELEAEREALEAGKGELTS
ncbi:ABC-F family ATP-binding cassette domain-containing protein [Pelagibius marinus]|uniref:ABC-F family ATP-binding cassette domain-containing protein n=1 Tax=Pelagibius marinus TaxID=2762760 RepID=UPI00187302DE|nr:ATP-binding cassette domain-containing protein [Pelagibius marinus]